MSDYIECAEHDWHDLVACPFCELEAMQKEIEQLREEHGDMNVQNVKDEKRIAELESALRQLEMAESEAVRNHVKQALKGAG